MAAAVPQKKNKIPSAKSEDQPTTRKMLYLVRDELSHRMNAGFGQAKTDLYSATTSLRTELKGNIANLRTELKGDIANLRTELKGDIANLRTELKGDIAELKADILDIKGDIADLKSDRVTRKDLELAINNLRTELKAEIAEVKSSLSRMHFLLEEQNSNNRIVLEGLQALWQRQDRLELKQLT